MITLYSFGKRIGVEDASPFVVKVDAFLRMAKLDYQNDADFNNLKKSPKGKLPFITDDNNSDLVTISDSEDILSYLTSTYNIDLDHFLTDKQKAQAHLITKSLDENLYWCLVYSRWALEETWPLISQTFFGAMPFPLKTFVPKLIRKSVIKNLHGQGMGRHSKEEILAIADKSFAALSTLLADQDYIFGSQVCSFDAVIYSHLCEFISVDFDNEFNVQAKKYENLVVYCQRIEQRYYQ